MDQTRLIAHLPHMDMEVARGADDRGEVLTIRLRGTPDLDSAAQFFGANLLANFPQMMAQQFTDQVTEAVSDAMSGAISGHMMNPATYWMQATQQSMHMAQQTFGAWMGAFSPLPRPNFGPEGGEH